MRPHDRKMHALAFVFALFMSFVLMAVGADGALAQEKRVIRLSGADRYATAVSVSKEAHASSSWAVLCTGENFADCVSSTPLAGLRKCSILFAKKDALPNTTKAELERLGVKNLYLMGGQAALGPSVEAAVKSMGINTIRVAGSDRYETSAKALVLAREHGSTSETVILATGTDFLDAISIDAWSSKTGSPIVLVGKDGKLSSAAVEAIKSDPFVKHILMVGNASSVSNAVESQLGNYRYERLAGGDAYETNRKCAEWACGAGLDWRYPVLATGGDYADALAGGALAGAKGSPLLLVSPATLKAQETVYPTWEAAIDPTVEEVNRHADEIKDLYIVGGEAAVSKDIRDAVVAIMQAYS